MCVPASVASCSLLTLWWCIRVILHSLVFLHATWQGFDFQVVLSVGRIYWVCSSWWLLTNWCLQLSLGVVHTQRKGVLIPKSHSQTLTFLFAPTSSQQDPTQVRCKKKKKVYCVLCPLPWRQPGWSSNCLLSLFSMALFCLIYIGLGPSCQKQGSKNDIVYSKVCFVGKIQSLGNRKRNFPASLTPELIKEKSVWSAFYQMSPHLGWIAMYRIICQLTWASALSASCGFHQADTLIQEQMHSQKSLCSFIQLTRPGKLCTTIVVKACKEEL